MGVPCVGVLPVPVSVCCMPVLFGSLSSGACSSDEGGANALESGGSSGTKVSKGYVYFHSSLILWLWC